MNHSAQDPSFDDVIDLDLPAPGAPVEILSSFTQSWVHGFVGHETVGGAMTVRRLSDGAVLPVAFTADRIRPALHESRQASIATAVR